MQPRDKRDLPEVVAEILIEQHAMREEIVALRQDMQQSNRELREELGGLREEIQQSNRELREEIQQGNRELREELGGLRQEMKASNNEMVAVFNNMTNAILDAMNRGTDRYNGAADEIDHLKGRVTRLENPGPPAA